MRNLTKSQAIEPTEATLVDLLRARAATLGDQLAFRFVRDRGGGEDCLSFRKLHERAQAIGSELQALAAPGERAMLLFPPGLEFIPAFFGCLYAGIVAVPVAFGLPQIKYRRIVKQPGAIPRLTLSRPLSCSSHPARPPRPKASC